jgi:hypothetical protein
MLASPAFAEKMNVRVLRHTVGDTDYTKIPDDGSSFANCDAYASTANCRGSSSTSTVSSPPQTAAGSLTDVLMTLLLPDGRTIDVGCEDHLRGLTNAHRHNCKNPTTNDLEANFSGDKVKLTWVAEIGGKKKDSGRFTIIRIVPAPTSTPTP